MAYLKQHAQALRWEQKLDFRPESIMPVAILAQALLFAPAVCRTDSGAGWGTGTDSFKDSALPPAQALPR